MERLNCADYTKTHLVAKKKKRRSGETTGEYEGSDLSQGLKYNAKFEHPGPAIRNVQFNIPVDIPGVYEIISRSCEVALFFAFLKLTPT